MRDTKVLSFRVPVSQVAVVEKAARIRKTTAAEFMRRAVMRQVRAALLEDAVRQAAEQPTKSDWQFLSNASEEPGPSEP